MNTAFASVRILILAMLLQFAVLVLFVVFDPYMARTQKKSMLFISLLVFTLVLSDSLESYFELKSMTFLRTLASVYGYCVRPLILYLYIGILNEEKKYRWLWLLVAANTLLYLTAFFSGLTFRITPENVFIRGPLGFTCHIVSGILLLIHIRETLRIENPRTRLALLSALGIIIASMAADLLFEKNYVSYVTVTMTSVCLIYYFVGLHLRLADEHATSMVNEQKIKILISQIQPHFLFNTLSTIQALCRIDPEKASEVTEKFGSYLHGSIDSLNQDLLIPFSKELEHTRTFAEIECIRFPSLQMEYDIRDTDFSIPALTVQPMVENAIRHGVRSRAQGTVCVETYRDGPDHVVVVRDNGIGFDVSSLPEMSGTHIGIQNVNDRLQMLCGGTLRIDSKIGKGTEVILRIPQREEET